MSPVKRRSAAASDGTRRQHQQQHDPVAALSSPPDGGHLSSTTNSTRKREQQTQPRHVSIRAAAAVCVGLCIICTAGVFFAAQHCPSVINQYMPVLCTWLPAVWWPSGSSSSGCSSSSYNSSETGDTGYSSSSSSQVRGFTAPDGTVYGPSLGIFPRGCQWRDVQPPNSSSVSYQYWDAAAGAWSDQQPAACRVQAFAAPGFKGSASSRPWSFHKGNPRTEVVPAAHHVTYRNLWYNNGRWYALVDSARTVPSWKFSKNNEVTTLHVRDAREWLRVTRWRVVPGDTLLFDFIFFTHPTAIGHWWELLGPLFSVLKSGAGGFKRPCDQMVLLHLKRTHLMEWVRAVMSVALGIRAHQDLPPVLLQQETDDAWGQLVMPLEGVSADEWVMFDRVLIVRDLFTGGNRSFTSSADARQFRAAVYEQYGLPRPSKPWRIPRTLTFQRKRANRRIVNEAELLQLLSQYGDVRVVEFNASTPFAQQLRVMRDTGVFVSAHTSNLANAVFLQPGSAVVELIMRHWTWNNMDQSFRDHTAALGDLHHFAWRANHPNETVYHSERDAARFTNWTKAECLIEDCTEAATRVDIAVDLHALKALLDSRLPLVFRGVSVKAAALPWPEAL